MLTFSEPPAHHYKIDRLSRSLADFAKLVEIFDEHKVRRSRFFGQSDTPDKNGIGVLHIESQGRDEALRRIPSLMSEGTWYGRVEGRLKPKGGDPGQSFLSDGEYEAVLKDHVNLPPNGAARRNWIPTVYPLNPKMMIPLEPGSLHTRPVLPIQPYPRMEPTVPLPV